jgi:hypothetical protein
METTGEEREAPHFIQAMTQALAEADIKEDSNDEPRR